MTVDGGHERGERPEKAKTSQDVKNPSAALVNLKVPLKKES